MQTPTLAEFFQQAGIARYPSFAPFVKLAKVPFKSQVQGLTLCVHNQWFGLLDETGAGKSLPAVAAALHYIGMGNKVLVVTLASLVHQFAESITEDFIGVDKYVKIAVLNQGPAQRKAIMAEWDATQWPEVLVISYEMFAVHKLGVTIKAAGYDVLITDESQKWKNPDKVFAKSIAEFLGNPKQMDTAFFPMTGTPMHTSLVDCYPLINLLSPGAYRSHDAFLAKHCIHKRIPLKEPRKLKNGRKQTHFKVLTGYCRHEELSANLYQRARRVMKKDIPELRALKDPIISEVAVVLSPAHKALYRKLLDEKFLELGDGSIITALQEQELRQKMLQIISCPELFIDPDATIDNQVMAACDDLISAATGEGKVILFLNFQESVRRYAQALSEYKPVLMYGGVSAAERERSRESFLNDPECRLLIANPKSAGAGFNFQSVCHTTIFGEPTASPGDFKQAMDRIVRPGQLWQSNIYVLKALGTVSPNAIKEMLRRDGDISKVSRDKTSLRSFYNFA